MREDFLTESVRSWGSASTFEGEASTALEFAAEAWRKQREMQKKNPEGNLKIRVSEKEDIPESTGISEASEDERKFILNTGEIVAYLVRARLAGEDPGKPVRKQRDRPESGKWH